MPYVANAASVPSGKPLQAVILSGAGCSSVDAYEIGVMRALLRETSPI